jgi:hypothetical protein
VTRDAAPKHACVRVGPMSAGTLTVGWPQPCDCPGGLGAVRPAVTGTLLAADGGAPVRRLEAADVIVASGGSGCSGPGEWLDRYPGCAVAVSWAKSGECSIATRNGVLRRLAVSGQQGDGGALACGIFMHGWLAVGLPLSLLSPACLCVTPGTPVAWPWAGGPLFFRFGYYSASGDDPPGSGSASSPAGPGVPS